MLLVLNLTAQQVLQTLITAMPWPQRLRRIYPSFSAFTACGSSGTLNSDNYAWRRGYALAPLRMCSQRKLGRAVVPLLLAIHRSVAIKHTQYYSDYRRVRCSEQRLSRLLVEISVASLPLMSQNGLVISITRCI